jgi:hypothetical protein
VGLATSSAHVEFLLIGWTAQPLGVGLDLALQPGLRVGTSCSPGWHSGWSTPACAWRASLRSTRLRAARSLAEAGAAIAMHVAARQAAGTVNSLTLSLARRRGHPSRACPAQAKGRRTAQRAPAIDCASRVYNGFMAVLAEIRRAVVASIYARGVWSSSASAG